MTYQFDNATESFYIPKIRLNLLDAYSLRPLRVSPHLQENTPYLLEAWNQCDFRFKPDLSNALISACKGAPAEGLGGVTCPDKCQHESTYLLCVEEAIKDWTTLCGEQDVSLRRLNSYLEGMVYSPPRDSGNPAQVVGAISSWTQHILDALNKAASHSTVKRWWQRINR